MIEADGVVLLLLLGVWIFCVIDVITTPEEQMRNLPKIVWVLIVLLLTEIGALLWLVAGRTWNKAADLPYKGNRGNRGDRAGGTVRQPARGPARATNPDDDEAFLAGLRARAEEQRRRARDEGRDPDPGAPPTAR